MLSRLAASPYLRSLSTTSSARHFAVSLNSVSKESLLNQSDYKWLGDYVQTVGRSADAGEHPELVDLCFRKKFRKISQHDALAIIEKVTEEHKGKIEGLDGSFWLWETLEEALHGKIPTLSQKEFEDVTRFFAVNFKGSDDFLEELMHRTIKDAPFPMPFSVSYDGPNLTLCVVCRKTSPCARTGDDLSLKYYLNLFEFKKYEL